MWFQTGRLVRKGAFSTKKFLLVPIYPDQRMHHVNFS